MDVFREIIHNLLLALRLPLRVVVDRLPEAGEILLSLRLGQLRHLRRDALHFLQPDLMHLRGRDVHGGHHLHGFRIAPLAVRQAFDRELGASFGVVIGSQEFRELLVSGNDIVVNRFRDLVGQPLLVRFRKVRWKLLRRQEEWVRGDDAVALAGQFLEHELGRHQAVLEALSHHLGRLIEHARDLVQPGNVILVVRHGIERHAQRQIGQPGVDAILLVHRHLIILQAVVDVLPLQLPLQQTMAQQVVVAHPVGRDRFQPL